MQHEKIIKRPDGADQYTDAWEQYKNSPSYEGARYALAVKGLVQPYLDNILRSAFYVGYNFDHNHNVKKKRSRCDYRKSECSNKGNIVNGIWVCSKHKKP